jgi:hypothetical protein
LLGCVIAGAGVVPGLLEKCHDVGHRGPVIGAGRSHGLDLSHLLHVGGGVGPREAQVLEVTLGLHVLAHPATHCTKWAPPGSVGPAVASPVTVRMVADRLSTFKNADVISVIQDDKIIERGDAQVNDRKQERCLPLPHTRQLEAEIVEFMRSLSFVSFSAILGLYFMEWSVNALSYY